MDEENKNDESLFIKVGQGVLKTCKNNAMDSADDLSYYYNQHIKKSYTNYDPYSYALDWDNLE